MLQKDGFLVNFSTPDLWQCFYSSQTRNGYLEGLLTVLAVHFHTSFEKNSTAAQNVPEHLVLPGDLILLSGSFLEEFAAAAHSVAQNS